MPKNKAAQDLARLRWDNMSKEEKEKQAARLRSISVEGVKARQEKRKQALPKLIVPAFATEQEEAEWWDNLDITQYDLGKAVPLSMPNLRNSKGELVEQPSPDEQATG